MIFSVIVRNTKEGKNTRKARDFEKEREMESIDTTKEIM
jgi:hypothetical protein